jgi:hypothetical protein
MLKDLIGAKCGDVFLFGGIQQGFLDSLENLYNKSITNDQFGAVHTYAIFITKQEKKELYYLLWKPFLGFRWLKVEDVYDGYVRLEDVTDFDRKKTLNIDLGLGELGVKQDHFNKWGGDELTNKLIDYLSRKDVTAKYQALMQQIADGLKKNKYRPKGILNRMVLDRIIEAPYSKISIQKTPSSSMITCPHCKAKYVYTDAERETGLLTCKNCAKSFEITLE